VDAVPMITVAGRYLVVGDDAKGYAHLLAIADRCDRQCRHTRDPLCPDPEARRWR
jgi:hypothetical protein